MTKKELQNAQKWANALRRYQRTVEATLTVRWAAVLQGCATSLDLLCAALEDERELSSALKGQLALLDAKPDVAALAEKLVATDAALGGRADHPELAGELARLRKENAELKFRLSGWKSSKSRAAEVLGDVIAAGLRDGEGD